MSKLDKMKKCEMCGKIYDVHSTVCLGLFCNHNELIEIFGEDNKTPDPDVNKSKKCPKCGKLYDAQSNICLGSICGHAELIDVNKKNANTYKKTGEINTLNPQEENVDGVYYDD